MVDPIRMEVSSVQHIFVQVLASQNQAPSTGTLPNLSGGGGYMWRKGISILYNTSRFATEMMYIYQIISLGMVVSSESAGQCFKVCDDVKRPNENMIKAS